MTKLMVSTFFIIMTVGFFISNAWSFPEVTGKSIFTQSKCASCHSITKQGIQKVAGEESKKDAPDLSAVGTKHNADWITKFLLKKETLNDKKHLKKFKGSDDELETLSTWLASLKSK